jgi:predicted acyl esterase
MRDGASLPADIYLPQADAKRLPCIVVRAPNGRQGYAELYAPLAKGGYAVILQDTRSRQDLEGKTLPYLSDGWGELQDGYDTLK